MKRLLPNSTFTAFCPFADAPELKVRYRLLPGLNLDICESLLQKKLVSCTIVIVPVCRISAFKFSWVHGKSVSVSSKKTSLNLQAFTD